MENALIIGEILKPQGIRGELKVRAFTDTADDLGYYKTVYIDETPYKVLSFRIGDGAVFLGLRGVPDRNAAELLRGKLLQVPKDEAKPAPEGSYYIVDLLGCQIVTEEGEVLGELADITQAATDVYTIQTGKKDILFPVAEGVVTAVDLDARKITVNKARFLEVAVL